MKIENLRGFATSRRISLPMPEVILREAGDNVEREFNESSDGLKVNFDSIVEADENETHRVYKKYEQLYVNDVLGEFISHLISTGEIRSLDEVANTLKTYSPLLDEFYVSLANGRKARAGRAFAGFHVTLLKRLRYPVVEKPKIDGKPNILLPSMRHFESDASDCITFTAKRTLRERWQQIATGRHTFLATIDRKLTRNVLDDIESHEITLICPANIKQCNYKDERNVLSFQDFFRDHLDPAMKRWKENGELGDHGVLNGDIR